MKYILELNEEQARTVSAACEFFSRVKCGQFGRIVEECVGVPYPDNYEEVAKAMLKFRSLLYPDLHGIGHSYGMGKFRDADLAFDVHQVIRKQFGDPREPFSYHELPRCYAESDRHSIVLEDGDADIEVLRNIMRSGTPIVSVSYDDRMENGNE